MADRLVSRHREQCAELTAIATEARVKLTELRQASEAANLEVRKRADDLERRLLAQRRLRLAFCERIHAMIPGAADPTDRAAAREVKRLVESLRRHGVDLSAVSVRWAGTPALALDTSTDGGPLLDAGPATRAEGAIRRAAATE